MKPPENSALDSQDGAGAFLIFAKRRRALLAGMLTTTLAMSLMFVSITSQVIVGLGSIAVALSLALLLPSATILDIAAVVELGLVRVAAKLASRLRWTVWVFCAYVVALGASHRPDYLQFQSIALIAAFALLTVHHVLTRAKRIVAAADVRGPSKRGVVLLVSMIVFPVAADLTAVAAPALAPFIGVLLVVYGLQCLASHVHFWQLVATQRFRGLRFIESAPVQDPRGWTRLVDWTDEWFNSSHWMLGSLGLVVCYAVNQFAYEGYRERYLTLRLKALFSRGRLKRVIELSKAPCSQLRAYLYIHSLIRLGRREQARQFMDEIESTEMWLFSPHIRYARAILALESFRYGEYEEHIREALGEFSTLQRFAREIEESKDAAEFSEGYCPLALAERARIVAWDRADCLPREIISEAREASETELRRWFAEPTLLIESAKRRTLLHSVHLYAEVRAIEGYIRGLAGDYGGAYKAFGDALACGEHLEARYHLGVLLMVGSASFARPIYHFRRVMQATPKSSRLHILASSRCAMAEEAVAINSSVARTWKTFRLVTFGHELALSAHKISVGVDFLKWRDDRTKRHEYVKIWGHEPSGEWTDWETEEWVGLARQRQAPESATWEVENEKAKKENFPAAFVS
jgi:hypothetical protein